MKYSKIFIDVSMLYHRAYNAPLSVELERLSSGEMINTSGIFISLKMIQRIEREFLESQGLIYFIFDNTRSGENKRKLIDPEYKAYRKKKEDSFYRGLDYLNLILINFKNNYRVVKHPGFEADDLISPLIAEFKEDTILLVSNDLDWFQVISEDVHIAKYEYKEYIIFNREKFFQKFNFYPTKQNLCLYKAFRGDRSDNIPRGVSGFREKELVQLIKGFDSLEDIINSLDKIEFLSNLWKDRIKENIPRLRLNMQLVTLREITFKILSDSIIDAKFSPKILKSLYKSLNFNSSFDPRIESLVPEKRLSFFDYEPIPRM